MAKQPKGEARDISKNEKIRRNKNNQAAEEMFNTYIKPGMIAVAVCGLLMFFNFFWRASAQQLTSQAYKISQIRNITKMEVIPTVSIAPMLDVTNRFFRYFFRQLTKKSVLWTEMIVESTVEHHELGPEMVLMYDQIEHPVVCQLGGNTPEKMAYAAEWWKKLGYDEVNINWGCPSPRVKSGCFGASLMYEPDLVRQLVYEMKKRTNIPITVKWRLGVDDHDTQELTKAFVDSVHQGGCDHVILHARKAWLSGLSPAQNRNIPPLEYERVYDLVNSFPDMKFTINGGIKTFPEITEHLNHGVAGCMLGRQAYDNPWMFRNVDSAFYGTPDQNLSRKEILFNYAEWAQVQQNEYTYGKRGLNNSFLAKPITNLFHAERGANQYRRYLNQVMREKEYTGNFEAMITDLVQYMEKINPVAMTGEEKEPPETEVINNIAPEPVIIQLEQPATEEVIQNGSDPAPIQLDCS